MYATMPTPPISRKRAAPGANPLPAGPLPQAPEQFATPDNMMRWNGLAADGNNYADVSNQYMPQQPHINPLGQQAYQAAQTQPQQVASSAVALRDGTSRALVSAALHPGFDAQPDQWTNSETALVPATNGRVHEPDPEQQLREAVARARKIEEEATKEGSTVKRSIPPFVQKLSRCVCSSHAEYGPFHPCDLGLLLTFMQLPGQWQE